MAIIVLCVGQGPKSLKVIQKGPFGGNLNLYKYAYLLDTMACKYPVLSTHYIQELRKQFCFDTLNLNKHLLNDLNNIIKHKIFFDLKPVSFRLYTPLSI